MSILNKKGFFTREGGRCSCQCYHPNQPYDDQCCLVRYLHLLRQGNVDSYCCQGVKVCIGYWVPHESNAFAGIMRPREVSIVVDKPVNNVWIIYISFMYLCTSRMEDQWDNRGDHRSWDGKWEERLVHSYKKICLFQICFWFFPWICWHTEMMIELWH